MKIEENWRAETKELQNIIKVLTEENAQIEEAIEAIKNPKPHRTIPAPGKEVTI